MSAEKQKTILLVDDEAIIAMSEKTALEKYGYNVITALSGEEAVTAVETTPAIDLILMDINLGAGLDGTEAATIILRQRDIPVVFLSSHMEPEVVEKTEKITSYGYVVKDSSITVLDASIKMAFKLFEAKINEREKESQMEAALEALGESEARYRAFFNTSRDCAYITSAAGRWLFMNESAVELFGYSSREELKDVNIPDLYVHPQDRVKCIETTMKNKYNKEFPVDLRRKDGAVIHALITEVPRYDGDGKLIGFQGTIRNITERKQVETQRAADLKELRESEQWNKLILSTVLSGVMVIDAATRTIVEVNDTTLKLIGLPKEQVIGSVCHRFVCPAEEKKCPVLDLGKEVDSSEKILLSAAGEKERNIIKTVVPVRVQNRKYLIESFVDISERKQAESQREAALEALREREEQQQLILATLPIAIFTSPLDPEIDASWASGDIEKVTGFTVDQYMAEKDFWRNRIHADDRERVLAAYRDPAASDEIVLEYRWLCKDGNYKWFYDRAIKKRTRQGIQYFGMILDISERKEAEEAFLREKAFLDQLVESAPEAIVFGKNDGCILRINSEFCRLFGYKEKEVLGKNIDDLIASAEKKSEAFSVTQTVGKGEKFSLETVRQRKNGKPINVSLIGSPIIIDGQQVATYGIYRDISDRKRAETIQHIQYEIANAMIKAETLSGLLETVRNELSSLIDTTNFLLALYDEASGMFSAPFEKDEKDAIPQWPAKKSLTGLVIRQKHSMLLSKEQIRQMSEAGTIQLIGSRAETWLGVPLLINEKVLGAIVVQSYDKADAYDPSSVNIMEMIASQLSVYIERERAEDALRESEERYRALVENASDLVYKTDKTGIFTFVNRAAVLISGYEERELIGKQYTIVIHLDMRDQAIKLFGRQFVRRIQNTYFEYLLLTKDGREVWLGQNTQLIIKDGQVTGFQAVARDISERKQAEEEIKRQLAEKEILLKEVHHRIKNNIASIGGLISLRMQSVTNPEAMAILKDANSRVDSMRILYEKLLLTKDYADLSVKNYVESLSDSIVALFPDKAKVKLDRQIADFHLDAKQLFPLGIIINELLTNIMKYAFLNKDAGIIKISITNIDNHVTLAIQDNGSGLSAGFAINKAKGFGLTLVKMLSQQLGGSFSMGNHKGTRCKIEFDI
ncbi:MAG: PAS domain S-box protein [Acidobacteria bacterium]|nr:PAS domain S-box protein [Acidobacteriota bacterium]MBU4307044.1 PAS domain S-box protein [Acidobacteriota bacterium]MBU4405784.1 PAS domain S-box protein [Acidobacteriota bacterium]MCG2810249.1 PAS domain S-box protein [Candidatus Aminicenantes bacterium]